MTRRATVLDAVEPEATVAMNGTELARIGAAPGDTVHIASRRGAIALRARRDDGMPDGAVFVPFAYAEAAANLLTNPALDPQGKIPELKYCAVRVSAANPAAVHPPVQ
jgi:formate dehydrogenase major subunit